jgi:hypothetical protein
MFILKYVFKVTKMINPIKFSASAQIEGLKQKDLKNSQGKNPTAEDIQYLIIDEFKNYVLPKAAKIGSGNDVIKLVPTNRANKFTLEFNNNKIGTVRNNQPSIKHEYNFRKIWDTAFKRVEKYLNENS